MEIFSAVTVGLLLWYGGGLALQNAIRRRPRGLHSIHSAHVSADSRLAEKYNIMQAAMASSERIFTLLDTARPDQS